MSDYQDFLEHHQAGSVRDKFRNLNSLEISKSDEKKPGRLRKADSEKARHVSLRLPPLYMDLLAWVPGNGNAEKVKYLLDNFSDSKRRLDLQIDRLKMMIDKIYEFSCSLHKPDLKNKEEAYKKFLSMVERLKDYIQLIGLSFKELKNNLNKDIYRKLDLIFYKREFVQDELRRANV